MARPSTRCLRPSAVRWALEHRARPQARPDAPRRHRPIDAHHLAGAVEPVQVEREAHAERVDRTGAWEQEPLGRRFAQEGQADQEVAKAAAFPPPYVKPTSAGCGSSGLDESPGGTSGAL